MMNKRMIFQEKRKMDFIQLIKKKDMQLPMHNLELLKVVKTYNRTTPFPLTPKKSRKANLQNNKSYKSSIEQTVNSIILSNPAE